MILKTPIWLVHLAANQSSVMSIPTMSSNCNFNQHINNVYKQCSRLSGWILRTFISRDSLTLLTLFKCIVLSRLDYGSQLWSPHQIKSINKIEQVQRSFTRFITGMRPLSYDERLKSLPSILFNADLRDILSSTFGKFWNP